MVFNTSTQRVRLFLFSLLVISAGISSAQSYTFRQAKSNYVELEEPDYTIPEGSPGFGNISLRQDFEFPAFGTSYDFNEGAKIVMLQGHMFHVNATRSFTFYFFEVDLKGRDGTDEVSEWSYKLIGTKGNQTLKMQWKNMGLANGGSDDFVNYQVWLYERTGRMEVRIGPNSISEGAYGEEAGPAIGVLEMTPGFSQIYEEGYLQGPAASPEFKQVRYNFLMGTPDEGTIYVFENPEASNVREFDDVFADMELYPTVASEYITLSLPNATPKKSVDIQIVNVQGQVVSSHRISTDQTRLNISGLKPGVYILELHTQKGFTTSRFVKE